MTIIIISSVLILVGAVLMSFSIASAHKTRKNVPEELQANWFIMSSLMVFFLSGYLFVVIVLLRGLALPLELMTGSIFLGGAFFVLLVINLSKTTISRIKEREKNIRDANEQVRSRNVALQQEIARRAQAERALQDANNELERKVRERTSELGDIAERLTKSNNELQDFAYIASHDLQEPLRKVQAFGDRLKVKYAENLEDQGRDYLERMQNAAGRMQTLINGLDLLARGNQGTALRLGRPRKNRARGRLGSGGAPRADRRSRRCWRAAEHPRRSIADAAIATESHCQCIEIP